MQTKERLLKSFGNITLIVCSLVVFFISCCVGYTTISKRQPSKSVTVNFNTCIEIPARFTFLFSPVPTPEILKTKSGHPLDLQNFSKTRPRGLPGQEPVSKYSQVSGLQLNFPAELPLIIRTPSFSAKGIRGGSASKIRPPPISV